MEIPDKLFTSAEVAKLFGVSLRTVYRYLESGKLKSTQIPTGRHRFTKQNLEEFLNPGNAEPRKAEEAQKMEIVEKNLKIEDTPRVKAGARGVPSSENKYHYFVSPVNDLKTLARTIKKSSEMASIPYSFTLYAGASLHHPIKAFTVLHIYIDGSDIEFFKKRLLLKSSDKEVANVCLIEAQSHGVFEASYEKGGFMIVSDERLYDDLLSEHEEELARGLKETTGL